jgi:hypothetical protein
MYYSFFCVKFWINGIFATTSYLIRCSVAITGDAHCPKAGDVKNLELGQVKTSKTYKKSKKFC